MCKRADLAMLWLSIGSFFVMAASFPLMPIEETGILPGILFWAGLLSGSVLLIVLEYRRRALFKAFGVDRKKMQKPRNGMLTFGSNPAATAVDVALAVSVAVMILTFLITKGYGFVCYILIATTIFSFCLHCILNGRIYFHVKNQNKVRQVLEAKKASINKKEREK